MNQDYFSCCFTGYRPQKLPFPIARDNKDYIDFENDLFMTVQSLAKEGCRTFYTGMAMGFDIIAAECVLVVASAKKFSDIRLICALPFKAQAKKYPQNWKMRYDSILEKASEIVIISNDYYSKCYYDRNRFMVDNSDCVLTWFDGSPGGTKNTIDYAKSIMRKVININSEYGYDRSNHC